MNAEQPTLDLGDVRSWAEKAHDEFKRSLHDRARSTGLASARVGDPDGFELALEVLERLAGTGATFTADDVRSEVVVASNAVGAAFRHAARQGLIEQVGFVSSQAPSRHGAVIRSWRGSA